MTKTNKPVLRELGKTGMTWTSIGLGTWNIEKDSKTAVAALRAGLDEGANHIDTAEMYGDGRAEKIVAEAMHGRREKIFVVSKVLPSNASYDGTIAACHRSLERLKTDYLDVYLLHWRDGRTKIAETFRAFEKLKTDGKIRAWGVSNFDVDDLEEAVGLVGEGKIACNQVLYHLGERSVETNVLPWCRDHNIAVVAYSPLGQGRLLKESVLDDVAGAHGAAASQIALAFLTKDPSVLAIPKSSDGERTRSNVQSMNIVLNAAEIHKIDDAFPVKRRNSLPMG